MFSHFMMHGQKNIKSCEIYCVETGTGTGLFTEH